ncbi:MAG: ATP-binding protein, partial [Bacteroidota bacterium]
ISTYSVFVRDDSEFEIVDDVKDKVVLVQDGDLGHDFVVENSFGGEIITYPDFDEVFEKFSDGIGDCLIHSRLQGIRYLKRNNISDIRVLDESVLQQKYCMAVAEGNEKLLAVLNEGLSILKTNGTYDTIYNKWFGAYEKDPMNWRDFFIYFLWVFLPLLVITLAALLWSYSLKKQVRKKTEALNRELIIKNRIQEELENNRQQLEDQNKKLLYQNHEIARINEELALAKDNAEKNDYQKTAFLANMSHEIRTPMNAIIGFCELLDQDPAEDETSKYTEIIAQSAQRLLHLLNDIIDISKIESGQIGIHKTHVNAERLVNSLVAFYQMQARNKGLNFIFSPDEKYRNFEFSTDEHRVTQVLNNFLSNAFRHTDFGTIEVGYTIRENHSILFWVKDTGKGIDAEEQGQVFERFYQAKTHQAGGAGLGLAIAKSIVEYMGGEIGLESKIGEGSTFWFSLPV